MRRFLPLVLVVLASCGGEEVVETSSTAAPATTAAPLTTVPTTAAPTTATTAPAGTAAPPTTAPAPGTRVEVDVTGEEVEGGGRVRVPLGEEVTLVVRSDVAEEVHVHGYDLFLELEPGVPGELVFSADVPGIFEVELEGSHRQILSLEVGG